MFSHAIDLNRIYMHYAHGLYSNTKISPGKLFYFTQKLYSLVSFCDPQPCFYTNRTLFAWKIFLVNLFVWRNIIIKFVQKSNILACTIELIHATSELTGNLDISLFCIHVPNYDHKILLGSQN